MPSLVPMSRRELVAHGAAMSSVDQDLRQGRTVAVFRGIHVDSALADDYLTRCAAALATQRPTATLCHRSSAVVQRLRWLPRHWSAADGDIDVAVPPGRTTGRRPGISLWERTLAADDVAMVDGLPCMAPSRTLVELARERRMAPLLVVQIIDGALRDELTSIDQLQDCLHRLAGHAHIARARSLISRARTGVDSAQETRLRLTLEDGGVTGLETDIRIEEDGRLLVRGELADPRLLLWGEYDGYEVHSEEATFNADRPRHRWVEHRGWRVLRYAKRDFDDPRCVSRDWLRAAAAAPARIAALPATLSPEVARARRLLGIDR